VLEAARDSLDHAEALALAATKAHNEPLVFQGAAAEQLDALLENPPPYNDYMKATRQRLAEMKERLANKPVPRGALKWRATLTSK
jgi:hypothetical protein